MSQSKSVTKRLDIMKEADGTPQIKFKNDSPRLQSEFDALKTKNLPLHDLLLDLVTFIRSSFNKDTILTMIFRTQEEQDELYKNDPVYQKKKTVSPHQLDMAADLRSTIFSPEEIKSIEDYLNGKYNSTNVFAWTAKNHVIPGNVLHFHIQMNKKV